MPIPVSSVITRTSAEELGLKKGDSVRVVVKSTEVMIQKDSIESSAFRSRKPCLNHSKWKTEPFRTLLRPIDYGYGNCSDGCAASL
jgi:hypothetical protein